MSLGSSGDSVGKVETWVEFLITRDIKLPYISQPLKPGRKEPKKEYKCLQYSLLVLKSKIEQTKSFEGSLKFS